MAPDPRYAELGALMAQGRAAAGLPPSTGLGPSGPDLTDVKTPKGGWATDPAKYAQQIRSQYGMSPTELASFLGLSYAGKFTGGPNQAGAGASVLTPGSDPAQYLGGAIASGPNAAQAFRAFSGYDLAGQELGYQFAGLNQLNNNLEGKPVLGHQTNVSMQGFEDLPSLTRLMGQLGTYASADNLDMFQQILDERNKDVPAWAAPLRDYLVNHPGVDIPYLPLDLLAGGGVNTENPNLPLFGADASPPGFFQLTGDQAGERAFYRSLDWDETMREIMPYYWAQYHREAGAPAPFEAGLTFGSPVLQADGSYEYSPILGYTGKPQKITDKALEIEGIDPATASQVDAYGNRTIDPQALLALGGNLYNRWLGYGKPGEGEGGYAPPIGADNRQMPEPPSIPEAIQQLNAWWQQTYGVMPNDSTPGYKEEKRRVEAEARALNEQYYWWRNPLYAMWENLDPEDAARFEALRNDPIQQYVG